MLALRLWALTGIIIKIQAITQATFSYKSIREQASTSLHPYQKFNNLKHHMYKPEMDLQFSSENRQPSKLSRKRLTQDQVRLLETCFNANQELQVDCKLELARRLGLPPRQIAVWYQNRCAWEKIHTIELDYKTIQQELDNVLAENRKLEQEVGMLKHELKKAQQMLLASNPSATLLPSLSTSGDNDLTSSSLPLNMTCNWEDTGLLPMDELYCLISPQGQPENHSMNDLSMV